MKFSNTKGFSLVSSVVMVLIVAICSVAIMKYFDIKVDYSVFQLSLFKEEYEINGQTEKIFYEAVIYSLKNTTDKCVEYFDILSDSEFLLMYNAVFKEEVTNYLTANEIIFECIEEQNDEFSIEISIFGENQRLYQIKRNINALVSELIDNNLQN